MTELSQDKKQYIEQEAEPLEVCGGIKTVFLKNGNVYHEFALTRNMIITDELHIRLITAINRVLNTGATAEATKSLILIEALEKIKSCVYQWESYKIATDALKKYKNETEGKG